MEIGEGASGTNKSVFEDGFFIPEAQCAHLSNTSPKAGGSNYSRAHSGLDLC